MGPYPVHAPDAPPAVPATKAHSYNAAGANGAFHADPSFYDVIADFAADPPMGCDACAANTTYFSDGEHPSIAGHAILGPIAQAARAIDPVRVLPPRQRAAIQTDCRRAPMDPRASAVLQCRFSPGDESPPAADWCSRREEVDGVHDVTIAVVSGIGTITYNLTLQISSSSFRLPGC